MDQEGLIADLPTYNAPLGNLEPVGEAAAQVPRHICDTH
jgi:uncharacterized protein with HEPN domain